MLGKHKLVCHPDTPQTAVMSISANAGRRSSGYVRLSYYVKGALDQIEWPGDALSGFEPWEREDRLWEHSCFEAFGATPDEAGYFEVNLTTAARWAAYGFYDRREGMRPAEDITLITANWRIRPRQAELHAMLQVPVAYEDSDWLIGLTAVIEAKNGSKSYWALAHAPGPPDFHNRDCFTVQLPAAS